MAMAGASVPWVLARALRRHPKLYWPARRAYTAVNGVLPPVALDGIPGPVHRNDLMLDRSSAESRQYYVETALDAVALVRDALRDAGGDLARAEVLDFGCGHGRVVRHFAQAAGSISACDLDHEGVRFCARRLGARPILGHTDLSLVRLATYDAIWVGSVLTHLPVATGRDVLHLLAAHLRPGGVLVVTTASERTLEQYLETMEWLAPAAEGIRAELDGDGATYITYPQNPDGSYGLTFHTDGWLDASLAPTGVEPLWHRADAWGIQDVHAWRRPSA
jgi:SAM-dependent methyltransferase